MPGNSMPARQGTPARHYGCETCSVTWVGGPTCWVCGGVATEKWVVDKDVPWSAPQTVEHGRFTPHETWH